MLLKLLVSCEKQLKIHRLLCSIAGFCRLFFGAPKRIAELIFAFWAKKLWFKGWLRGAVWAMGSGCFVQESLWL